MSKIWVLQKKEIGKLNELVYYSYENGTGEAPTGAVVLEDGETTKVMVTKYTCWEKKYEQTIIVRNNNGQVVEEDDKEAKKEFAKSQMEWLMEDLNYTKDQAWRIMKASGPGQVRLAYEWACTASEVIQLRIDALQPGGCIDPWGSCSLVDTLDVILSGVGGVRGFGKDRMEGVLNVLGLPIPDVQTAARFVGVLKGAHAFITMRHYNQKEKSA